jgi:histidine ammonia-lyase
MLLKPNIEDRYSQVHLSKCFELYREEVSFVKEDRILHYDIEAAYEKRTKTPTTFLSR